MVYNTIFKEEDSKIITYQCGDNSSMINHLMIRKTECCIVKDVKVITSEECVTQHQMVIGKYIGYPHEATKRHSLHEVELS